MEPIDLCSDDEPTNELNGVVFDWKEAQSLSEIGHRTPILGDGNCGFRALFEGLKEKQLIGVSPTSMLLKHPLKLW